MYSIYADDVCIYDDISTLESVKLIEPSLTLTDSAAGSLSITVPPTNAGYDKIVRMVTDIFVYKENEEIWSGRVLTEEKDFWNNRVLYCEGELAFLNDTIQPPNEYHNETVRGFLEILISTHNKQVTDNRKFTVGAVTVTDPNDSLYRYTNYETTMECVNDKLINRLGGHIRIRKENGIRYLDYLAEYPNTNSQTIEFGKNLLDFTRKWDMTEFATAIVPLGTRLEKSSIEALEAYLTVEAVNKNSIYISSADAVATYGWIVKVVKWDDVTTPQVLKKKAINYLKDIQFDNVEIELSALDLHYLNADYEKVKLLDQIRVISKPHGMDRYFPVSQLTIPLDEPENTQFTLGSNFKTSLTSINNQTNSDILQKINNQPKKQTILKEAKENATEIMNLATNGYVTITQDDYGTNSLYISDNVDYTKASKLWKWNLNGLGYSKDGGKTYGLAMTMDGAIVADYITTGTLNASLIKTGKLMSNSNSKTYFDLTSGELCGSVLVDARQNSKLKAKFGTSIVNQMSYAGLVLYDNNNTNLSSSVNDIGGIIRYTDESTVSNMGLYSRGRLQLSGYGVESNSTSLSLCENYIYMNRKIGKDETFDGDHTTVFKADAKELYLSHYQTSSQYSYLNLSKDNVVLYQHYPPSTSGSTSTPSTSSAITLERGTVTVSIGGKDVFVIDSSGAKVNGITVTSERSKKYDIKKDDGDALSKIGDVNAYQYKLIGEDTQRYGFMVDELPDVMLSEDKKSVDLYASLTLAIKSIQELIKRVDILEQKVKEDSKWQT